MKCCCVSVILILYKMEMKPIKPSPSDCCGSGCTPCVFDVYEEELKKWESKCGESNFSDGSKFRFDLLSKLAYLPFKLINVKKLTLHVNLYRFQPFISSHQGNQALGLSCEIPGILDYKPSQHFILRSPQLDSKEVYIEKADCATTQEPSNNLSLDSAEVGNSSKSFISRPYTPVSLSSEEKNCCFDVVIKLYRNGAMSSYLEKLDVGDIVYFRGPYGGYKHEPNSYSSLILICAGAGIAPMISLIKSIIKDDDETLILLLFTVRTFNDIIFRQEIQQFCLNWNVKAKIFLTNEPDWAQVSQNIGYNEIILNQRIDRSVIKSEVLSRSRYQVLICGPIGFCEEMKRLLVPVCDKIYIF